MPVKQTLNLCNPTTIRTSIARKRDTVLPGKFSPHESTLTRTSSARKHDTAVQPDGLHLHSPRQWPNCQNKGRKAAWATWQAVDMQDEVHDLAIQAADLNLEPYERSDQEAHGVDENSEYRLKSSPFIQLRSLENLTSSSMWRIGGSLSMIGLNAWLDARNSTNASSHHTPPIQSVEGIQSKKVTSHHIAYAAVQVCFALSARDTWNRDDNNFSDAEVYLEIVDYFEGDPEVERVVHLLERWDKKGGPVEVAVLHRVLQRILQSSTTVLGVRDDGDVLVESGIQCDEKVEHEYGMVLVDPMPMINGKQNNKDDFIMPMVRKRAASKKTPKKKRVKISHDILDMDNNSMDDTDDSMDDSTDEDSDLDPDDDEEVDDDEIITDNNGNEVELTEDIVNVVMSHLTVGDSEDNAVVSEL
ncbi:hypothetical protein BDP27DRAFT_1425866 [Rhodocollybia butyracea]|uniref:Uncharacterized protein n=1 Tax=Rhodocollybia butyracea TaxID=206335 RepID=A0A9P5PEW4_9AGAR|nr:hypothetical protein BDP27DRAFT_1425866 [Rhodocollybia butyracea]